ncbi:hypothetical protein BDY24DRAFT_415258 [Mrakia frigida]|uniref:uncharacterized protein n=1 Tax=Mrakia frigida TaxID=29902 RepID=UPI003FCC1F27
MSSLDQLHRLVAHLQDTWPQTSKDLSSIGPSPLSLLHQSLFSLSSSPTSTSSSRSPKNRTLVYSSLLSLANDKLNSFPFASVPECWRRLYTETGFLWAIYDLQEAGIERQGDDQFWEGVVARLDMILIVAGAPGEGRRELIDDLIELVQEVHLPSPLWNPPASTHRSSSSSSSDQEDGSSPPPSKKLKLNPPSSSPSCHPLLLAPNPIPSLPHPPSLTAYLKLHLNKPFILRSYLQQTCWPALDSSSPWKDRDYLLSLVGRGRIVPVEIGGEYTEEGWGQGMIKFEDFLERIEFGLSEAEREKKRDEEREDGVETRPPLYLAQHALLTQFPKLRRDVLLPDYVYSEPPESEAEGGYRRPPTEDGLLINVWVGGEGRSSPSHTDPYYNCYTQVVGSKRIFLAPPHHSSSMYPFSSSPSSSSPPPTSPTSSSETNTPSSPPSATTTLMGNTSRLPIFNKSNTPPSQSEFPKFYEEALPESLEGVLNEGDMLVFPPGWWHALRQEGGAGWGVSFWY